MSEIVQGSSEWFDARRGKATASRIADAVGKKRDGGYRAERGAYLAELIAERLTGRTADHYVSPAMQWGTDCEPAARNAYQFLHGSKVDRVGFVDHPHIPMSGASPDGLVGADGLLQIKCPTTKTHIDTLLGAPILPEYLVQVQWEMACTDRRWCDFASFDPRLPEHLQLFVKRVHRDDKLIAGLEAEVSKFLQEVSDKVLLLNVTYAAAA